MIDETMLRACVQACYACAEACDECANAGMREGDAARLVDAVRLDLACADFCRFTAAQLARRVPLSREIAALCAKACEACAAECDRHDDECCRRSAAACHRCAMVCRRVAG